jgi:hypothetical protein
MVLLVPACNRPMTILVLPLWTTSVLSVVQDAAGRANASDVEDESESRHAVATLSLFEVGAILKDLA